MFLSEWREFPSAPCLAGKKNLMTARVSMLLKSRASLTCFRACFLPGHAKNLPAPRYMQIGFHFCVPKFYLICQAENNQPSFCPHIACRTSCFLWTPEQIVSIRLYLIVSCNRDAACLLRGPNLIFIYSPGSG